MIEQVAPYIANYGILAVWTMTLLYERKNQIELNKKERAEHIVTMQGVATNMALVNENLRNMANTINNCHKTR